MAAQRNRPRPRRSRSVDREPPASSSTSSNARLTARAARLSCRPIGRGCGRISSKIGAAVARAFRQAGARVAITASVERVIEEFGRLDFACNNAAGGGHRPTPLAEVPIEAFDAMQAISLRGVFLSMRAEIPAVVRSGGGAIVNMSSTAGLQGVGGPSSYVAAKHGVEGLTKVAALDYGGAGVRVNAVAPGPILTDHLNRAGTAAQQAAAAAMPVQRVGRPEEVAAAVVWLCSEQAAFITSTTLTIDGGRLVGTPPFQVTAGPR